MRAHIWQTINIMVDIETLATTSDAAIVALAARAFLLPGGGAPPATPSAEALIGFECAIGVMGMLATGATIDQQTCRWWGRQDQAGAAIDALHHETPRAALQRLTDFVEMMARAARTRTTICPTPRIWAQGAAFDIPILEGTYRRLGQPIPWAYASVRDTRTVYDLAEQAGWNRTVAKLAANDAMDGPAHTPMADCCRQIHMLAAAIDHIATRRLPHLAAAVETGPQP